MIENSLELRRRIGRSTHCTVGLGANVDGIESSEVSVKPPRSRARPTA
jgi:hypothetical protein